MQKSTKISVLFFTILFFVRFDAAFQSIGLKKDSATYSSKIKGMKKFIEQVNVQPVEIESRENDISNKIFKRKAFLATCPNALGTVIFCHGYTHSKHQSFFFKTFFPNFNALAFDFRAHGEQTDGQYSTLGGDEIHDVQAAVNFIRNYQGLKDKPIIGFGFSMGAVSLFRAQARWQNLFDMLILDSPFDSSSECMSQGLDSIMTFKLFGRSFKIPGKSLVIASLYNPYLSPIVKKFFKWVTGFNPDKIPTKFMHVAPIESAQDVKIPILFFACVRDSQVPVDSVKRLYQNVASPYKRIWITQGIQHCSSFLVNPELYWYRMNKFIEKVLDGDMKASEKIYDDRLTITINS